MYQHSAQVNGAIFILIFLFITFFMGGVLGLRAAARIPAYEEILERSRAKYASEPPMAGG